MSDELINWFKDRIDEEYQDVITYNDIYTKLIAEGCEAEASAIESIANQEWSNARWLTEMLDEHGIKITAEHTLSLKAKVERIFGF